jgi:hypothetical protein
MQAGFRLWFTPSLHFTTTAMASEFFLQVIFFSYFRFNIASSYPIWQTVCHQPNFQDFTPANKDFPSELMFIQTGALHGVFSVFKF